MRTLLRLRLLGTACSLAMPCLAAAQSVDYAALQDTMGEPVTTSVTGKPQRQSDAPASLVIITRDQIARSPAHDIPGLLQAYAGVDVNRWTAGQADVAVRGGVQTYNARLLVLVDGRQVYLDHYGMTDWGLLGIQVAEIQQIELVRGPASALFGFNAASAVVNIITVDPLQRSSVSGSAELGNHGQRRIAAAMALPVSEKVGVKLSAGHQEDDERSIPASLYRPVRVTDTNANQVGGTISMAPGSATHVDLTGAYSDDRHLEFLPSQVLTEDRFRSHTAGLLVNQDVPWGSFTARTYANWLTARYGLTTSPSDIFSGVQTDALRNRIVVAEGSSLVRLGSGTFRLGAEYRNNQLRSASLFSPRIGYEVAAASAMVELHPADPLAITLAGRADRLWLDQGGAPVQPSVDPVAAYDRAFTKLSFNAAALLNVGGGGQLRLNGGRGFQLPSLIDFGLRLPLAAPQSPLPLFIAGDPMLRPVIVWSAELGYSQHLTDRVKLDSEVFYNRVSHVIASPGDMPNYQLVMASAPLLATRFANVGSFRSYGASASVDGAVSTALRWHLTYTWTRTRQDIPPVEPTISVALSPADTTPRQAATASIDYTRGRWFADVAARYTSATRQFGFSRMGALQFFAVEDALRVDAKLGLRVINRLIVTATGENLTAADGADGSPIPADRRVRLGVGFQL